MTRLMDKEPCFMKCARNSYSHARGAEMWMPPVNCVFEMMLGVSDGSADFPFFS